MAENDSIQDSYLRIRKLIGLLGLLLPILVVLFYGNFLPSISLFYYTRSAVFFIAILASFGLFLISYKGYKVKESEKKRLSFSDNFVTHIGGFAILFVVLFPTACNKTGLIICDTCVDEKFCLFGHRDPYINIVHLSGAALFFVAMGWMSLYNFTRGSDKKYHKIYKWCGRIIFIVLALLITEFLLGLNFTSIDIYIMETIMVFSFAISWLLKGRTIEYIGGIMNNFYKKKTV